MPRSATARRGELLRQARVLRGFDRSVQAYGTFLGGYAWDILGCGTYRTRQSLDSAVRQLHTFFDRLRKSLKMAPIAWVAVAERNMSGLGLPPGAWHWHFMMAAPPQHRNALEQNASALWAHHYGNVKIDAYNAGGNGSFYISKLAGGREFDFYLSNLDRLSYGGPTDFFAHFQSDPYVPQHARNRSVGKTLAIRSFESRRLP